MWWQALLTLIGGLIVLLAVPTDVRCQAGSTEVPPLRVRVRWLFGLLRLERALPGPSTTRAGTATPPARRPPGKGARVRFARIGRLALVERVLRLLGKLLRRISILHLEGRLRIGLDDPADTGILLGALLPLHALLRPHMRNGFTVAPEFAGECFEADADFEIRVVPLRLIGPAASFAAWFGVQAWRARGQRR